MIDIEIDIEIEIEIEIENPSHMTNSINILYSLLENPL